MYDIISTGADGINVQVAYPGDQEFYLVDSDYEAADNADTFGLLLGSLDKGFLMEGTLPQIRAALLLALRRVNDAVRDTSSILPDRERVQAQAGCVSAVRDAYVDALVDDEDSDTAALIAGLKARTYSADEPGQLSARHVVDVLGLTVDVQHTVHGLVVDLNDEERPDSARPVLVSIRGEEIAN